MKTFYRYIYFPFTARICRKRKIKQVKSSTFSCRGTHLAFFAIRVLAPNCSDRWSTVGSKRRDASTIVIKRDRVIQISFVPRKDEMDRVPSSWKKPLLLHRQSFESTNKLRNAHKLYSREANRSFRGDRCLTTNVFIYCEFYTRADRTLLGICIRIFPDEFGMHALVWIIWVSNMSDSFENISL